MHPHLVLAGREGRGSEVGRRRGEGHSGAVRVDRRLGGGRVRLRTAASDVGQAGRALHQVAHVHVVLRIGVAVAQVRRARGEGHVGAVAAQDRLLHRGVGRRASRPIGPAGEHRGAGREVADVHLEIGAGVPVAEVGRVRDELHAVAVGADRRSEDGSGGGRAARPIGPARQGRRAADQVAHPHLPVSDEGHAPSVGADRREEGIGHRGAVRAVRAAGEEDLAGDRVAHENLLERLGRHAERRGVRGERRVAAIGAEHRRGRRAALIGEAVAARRPRHRVGGAAGEVAHRQHGHARDHVAGHAPERAEEHLLAVAADGGGGAERVDGLHRRARRPVRAGSPASRSPGARRRPRSSRPWPPGRGSWPGR